ncbi:hypothetical protein [Massilia glaciei]|uniref:DUF697 domain-containing protein n=1 Tax=Massilia glaciei TaxID=1524097 RepID=A0A2U2HH26_9BURK|nr:hypothetical protein [Massilia glaciei]PWF44721.1 hypothetical protein C7C56_018865 [Massilia glaciei]
MRKPVGVDWSLIPGNGKDIEQMREHCRRLVRRRAFIAASVSAVPIPGVDVVSDLSLFTLLINDVNKAFGLTQQQVENLQPKWRLIAYQGAVGMGGMMVGRVITRELVMQLFKRAGLKMFAKSAARVVPIAGQIASAAIGFAVFRKLGYEHVDACAVVARELMVARP